MIAAHWLYLLLFFDITGTVVDDQGAPLEGVRIRVQASTGEPAFTDAEGRFTLETDAEGEVTVGAGKRYDADAAVNYVTTTMEVTNGKTDVQITLNPIPAENNDNYTPIKAEPPGGCGDCHSRQLAEWRASKHAHAATNSWVAAFYEDFEATHDPEDTGDCATCHGPNLDVKTPGQVRFDEISGTSPLEGVNCTACHQIDRIHTDRMDDLHIQGNATMRFPFAGFVGAGTHEYVWGPLDDVGFAFMKAAYQPQFEDSAFCGSCHEYVRPGTEIKGQSTYSEWAAGPYGDPESASYQTCQGCHMPVASEPGKIAAIAAAPDRPAEQIHGHTIDGGSLEMLQRAVDVSVDARVDGEILTVTARVANTGAGHHFPTGISIRNAILHVQAAGDAPLPFIDGSTIPAFGSDGDEIQDDGDLAGEPGTAYAKVLAGRINGEGEERQPVLFVDAERVAWEKRIPAGESDETNYRFRLTEETCSSGELTVTVRLLFRRVWRAIAVEKGLTADDLGRPWEETVAEVVWTGTAPGGVKAEPASPVACTDLGGEGVTATAAPYCLDERVTFRWSGGPIAGPTNERQAVLMPNAPGATYQLEALLDGKVVATRSFYLGSAPDIPYLTAAESWGALEPPAVYDADGDGRFTILDMMWMRSCAP